MALDSARQLLRDVENEIAAAGVLERLGLNTATPLDRAVAKLARAVGALADEVERLGQQATPASQPTGRGGTGPDRPA